MDVWRYWQGNLRGAVHEFGKTDGWVAVVSALGALVGVVVGSDGFWTGFVKVVAIALGAYVAIQILFVQPFRAWLRKSAAELTGSTEGAPWRLRAQAMTDSVLFELDDLRDAPPLRRYCVIQDPDGVCWTSEPGLYNYTQFPHKFRGAPEPPAPSGTYRVSWFDPPVQGTVNHRLIARGDFTIEFQETSS